MKSLKLPGNIIFLLFLFTLTNNQIVIAQQDKPYIKDATIDEQLEFVVSKSSTYENYNVIRKIWMRTLRKNVSDSISVLKSELKKTNRLLSETNAKYDTLLNKLNSTNEKLETAIRQKNSIEVLGMHVEKAAYNSITWLIIFGLTFGLIIFILLFRRRNHVTAKTKTDLSELKEEFDDFRKRALRREEKVVRELHDEINKYKARLKEFEKSS